MMPEDILTVRDLAQHPNMDLAHPPTFKAGPLHWLSRPAPRKER